VTEALPLAPVSSSGLAGCDEGPAVSVLFSRVASVPNMRKSMALAHNRLNAALWRRIRSKVGVRFTRFVVVAAAALTATEIALTLCNGVFHMTSTPAALVSWFCGAVVSYVLSRWAWERKGKPDVLRETVPFWVISAVVIVILTLAAKFAYHSAGWMHLTGIKHVLWVDFVWLVANFITFLLRFVIFHYVLFAERTTAARAAATGPDAVPPGTRKAPSPTAAPHTAARAATAEAGAEAAAGTAKSAAKADGAKRDSAKQGAPVNRSTTPQATPAD
jgi:putative flippase GtrA